MCLNRAAVCSFLLPLPFVVSPHKVRASPLPPVSEEEAFPVSATITPGQRLLVLFNSLTAPARVEATGCPLAPPLLTAGWQRLAAATLLATAIMAAAGFAWAIVWRIPTRGDGMVSAKPERERGGDQFSRDRRAGVLFGRVLNRMCVCGRVHAH